MNIFINWIWIATRFRDRQIWRTGSGNSAILALKSSDQEKPRENPYLWNKSRRQFSYAARCFMYKIVVYQTAPVWFVKNECFMAKIDVYGSLLASDRVIGWDIKMMSHPNSNASFINIWDRLIWRRSPNLTRSSKLAAAPNWWHLNGKTTGSRASASIVFPNRCRSYRECSSWGHFFTWK